MVGGGFDDDAEAVQGVAAAAAAASDALLAMARGSPCPVIGGDTNGAFCITVKAGSCVMGGMLTVMLPGASSSISEIPVG